MKKVIGKNQVIITSLAILIAVAGYLNFADVDLGFRDKEASTDSSSILEDAGYDLTDETALLDENQADGGLTDNSLTDSQETDTPGEAVFTGSTGFAAQAKISREQVRSQKKIQHRQMKHQQILRMRKTAKHQHSHMRIPQSIQLIFMTDILI